MARVAEHDAEVMAACGQIALVFGYCGVCHAPAAPESRAPAWYDFSASTVRPMLCSKMPMLSWLRARSRWYSATVRVVTRELFTDRQRLAVRLERLGRMSRFAQSSTPMLLRLLARSL